MNKGLVIAAFAVLLAGVFAISDAATGTVVEEGYYTYSGAQASDPTEGGNVTGYNLTGNDSTDRWAGYFGNVTGDIVLGLTESEIMYSWTWNGGAGEVCASAGAGTFDWANLAITTAADINTIFVQGAADDNATNTLTDATGTIDIDGTTVTSAAVTDDQSWETVAVEDGGGAVKEDYAFCVNMSSGAATVTGANGNYQLMVATQPATIETYYFFLELS